MTNQEWQEFYQKNKVVAIGVPFLIVFVLFNQFVLKPSREKKPAPQAVPAGSQVPMTAPGAAGMTPVGPPPPINTDLSAVPQLDQRLESRLLATGSFPFRDSKNIWYKVEKTVEKPLIVEELVAPVEESQVLERPDMSFNGFFKMGHDNVAILKTAERLLFVRLGQRIGETPFVLTSIYPDRAVITDTESGDLQFELVVNPTGSVDDPAQVAQQK